MQPYRSVMADMLRERHRLMEMLYLAPDRRDLIVQRLSELEILITQQEDLGSRTYLDHIMNRAHSSPSPQTPPQ